jgi:hypothetical protein
MTDTTHINFKVGFKSQTIFFENWSLDATINDVKHHLFNETSVPIESQKLLWKGRILKDLDSHLNQLSMQEGAKLMLMGSLPTQIEQVNQMDQKIAEQRRLAPTIRLNKTKLKQQQRRLPDPNANYTFHKISVIEEFPEPHKAKSLLERLRDDRGVIY